MNLLIISNNLDRPSFRQRIDIHLHSLRKNQIACKVAKLPSGLFARYKLFRKARDFDAVFLQKKSLNFLDAFWLGRYGKKIIYDVDDAVMYSPSRPYSNKTSHFRPFRRTVKLAEMVIAGNLYLAEQAREFNCNVKILPTGLDTRMYKRKVPQNNDDKIQLVWIGSSSTLQYLEEIRSVLEEIGRRFDNVVLRIICDDFIELRSMKVEKCRWSLKNEARDLVSSDVGLAPLSDNRFTRGKCAFKILQYQAAALPVVASPVGVNCDYVRDGVTGFLATEHREWVEKISRLIEDAELRNQMGQAGRMHAESFDAKIIGDRLCKLIIGQLQGRLSTAKTAVFDANTDGVKVSICIPTYNRKDYLKETLESIFRQSYKNYEIVIVDDGSGDGTRDMLRELDFPVTYHWQQNCGDAATRNKLIRLAQGQYLSFIDSDDLLMPDAIGQMVKVVEGAKEDVVAYGSYLRIDEHGRIYGKCKRKLYSEDITKHLFNTILVHCCGSMFPAKTVKNGEPFDASLKVCSDYDFWLDFSTRYKFVALRSPTFKRRRHPGNLSQASFENCLLELRVLERFYYRKAANGLVPQKMAMQRLAKALYRVGRSAAGRHKHREAQHYFYASLKKKVSFKALVGWGRAAIKNSAISSKTR